jgi:hypothetical protein
MMIMESEWRILTNAMIAVRLDELSPDSHKLLQHRPIPVAVPSKTKVWNSWTAGIAKSWDRVALRACMFFSGICCVSCKGGLCDELITRSEEFCRVCVIQKHQQ